MRFLCTSGAYPAAAATASARSRCSRAYRIHPLTTTPPSARSLAVVPSTAPAPRAMAPRSASGMLCPGSLEGSSRAAGGWSFCSMIFSLSIIFRSSWAKVASGLMGEGLGCRSWAGSCGGTWCCGGSCIRGDWVGPWMPRSWAWRLSVVRRAVERGPALVGSCWVLGSGSPASVCGFWAVGCGRMGVGWAGGRKAFSPSPF